MKQPDLLITHDTKILQQILQGVLGKSGNGSGVSISLPSINQINIYFGGNDVAAQIKGITGELAEAPRKSKEPLSKENILQVLESVGWSRSIAAKKLDRTFGGLCQRLDREGIRPPSGEWPKKNRRRLAEKNP